jgi:hypothetical protein
MGERHGITDWQGLLVEVHVAPEVIAIGNPLAVGGHIVLFDDLVAVGHRTAVPDRDRAGLPSREGPDVLPQGELRIGETPAGDGIGNGMGVGSAGDAPRFPAGSSRTHFDGVDSSGTVPVRHEQQVPTI